jgi:hypothetical protein
MLLLIIFMYLVLQNIIHKNFYTNFSIFETGKIGIEFFLLIDLKKFQCLWFFQFELKRNKKKEFFSILQMIL